MTTATYVLAACSIDSQRIAVPDAMRSLWSVDNYRSPSINGYDYTASVLELERVDGLWHPAGDLVITAMLHRPKQFTTVL